MDGFPSFFLIKHLLLLPISFQILIIHSPIFRNRRSGYFRLSSAHCYPGSSRWARFHQPTNTKRERRKNRVITNQLVIKRDVVRLLSPHRIHNVRAPAQLVNVGRHRRPGLKREPYARSHAVGVAAPVVLSDRTRVKRPGAEAAIAAQLGATVVARLRVNAGLDEKRSFEDSVRQVRGTAVRRRLAPGTSTGAQN
jgi:hypothetical protein